MHNLTDERVRKFYRGDRPPEVWKAYRVLIRGYYVGVIFGTGTGDAKLRAWDWYGCSNYDDRVEVHFIRNVDRTRCLRPWLMKGEKRVYTD